VRGLPGSEDAGLGAVENPGDGNPEGGIVATARQEGGRGEIEEAERAVGATGEGEEAVGGGNRQDKERLMQLF
jgi:hypothetical protein